MRIRHRFLFPGYGWLKGKSVDEALKIDNMDIVEEVESPR